MKSSLVFLSAISSKESAGDQYQLLALALIVFIVSCQSAGPVGVDVLVQQLMKGCVLATTEQLSSFESSLEESTRLYPLHPTTRPPPD